MVSVKYYQVIKLFTIYNYLVFLPVVSQFSDYKKKKPENKYGFEYKLDNFVLEIYHICYW